MTRALRVLAVSAAVLATTTTADHLGEGDCKIATDSVFYYGDSECGKGDATATAIVSVPTRCGVEHCCEVSVAYAASAAGNATNGTASPTTVYLNLNRKFEMTLYTDSGCSEGAEVSWGGTVESDNGEFSAVCEENSSLDGDFSMQARFEGPGCKEGSPPWGKIIGGAIGGIVVIVGSIVAFIWVRRNPAEARRLRNKAFPCCAPPQPVDAEAGGTYAEGGDVTPGADDAPAPSTAPWYACCWCAACGPADWIEDTAVIQVSATDKPAQ